MKRIVALLLTTLLLLSLTGCGAPRPHETGIYAMNTYMSLVVYGDRAEDALAACTREINALEQQLSRTREGSDIYHLNETLSSHPSENALFLLQKSAEMADITGGLFDVTIAPLVELWGITSDNPRVPAQEEIDALLPLVGMEHLRLADDLAELDEGCAVDLGGIAKGYASDRVADIFADFGIQSAAVSLGGNAYVLGTKPDSTPWSVGIQDPAGNDCCAYLSLSDAFVVTSGGYQRNFTAPDGTVYQHILDPRTGYPAKSDLTSVSIIGKDGTTADALSTALYIMGEKDAVAFWQAHPELDFDILLVTADGRIVTTLSADTVTIPEGSTYDFQTIA